MSFNAGKGPRCPDCQRYYPAGTTKCGWDGSKLESSSPTKPARK